MLVLSHPHNQFLLMTRQNLLSSRLCPLHFDLSLSTTEHSLSLEKCPSLLVFCICSSSVSLTFLFPQSVACNTMSKVDNIAVLSHQRISSYGIHLPQRKYKIFQTCVSCSIHDCFMIYGGQVANASARHRKQERWEVCSVKVAALAKKAQGGTLQICR